MLEELEVKNFKSLIDVDLKFGKLNLFIGPNNAGKSSILQLLVLLKQFQHGGDPYQGPYFHFKNYQETVSCRDESARIGVRIEKRLSDREVENLFIKAPKKLRRISFISIGDYQPSSIAYTLRIGSAGLEAQTIDLGTKELYDASIDYNTEHNNLKLDWLNLKDTFRLSGFNRQPNLFGPSWMGLGGKKEYDLTNFLVEMGKIMSKWLLNVQFLPVTRGIVEWKYGIDSVMPESFNPKDRGHSTANILLYLNREDHRHLLEKITKWTKVFGLEGIYAHVVEGPSCALDAKDPELGVLVNVAGAGFGVGQILPVIVESFRAPENSAILIEEPEIHLHPASQVKLVDLFREIIQEGKQLFVTTHSEHLLLRLQTRVAEEKISPEDVRIYYVSKDQNGTHAQPVTIGKDGSIAGGLPGFSDINEQELHFWLNAIKKRE